MRHIYACIFIWRLGMKKASNLTISTFVYFGILFFLAVLRIIFNFVKLPLPPVEDTFVKNIIVQVALLFVVSVFVFSKLKNQSPKETFKDFKFNKIGFLPIVFAILIGLCAFILNTFIVSFFRNIITFCGYENIPVISTSGSVDYSLFSFLIEVVGSALLPAICEETANRGLLLNGLSSMGITRALLISSVFFGLMHMNINQFFYATILGFLIGLSVVVSKSIYPAMIIHFMNNFLATYFSYASYNNWFLGDLPSKLSGLINGGGFLSSMLISILILAALIFALVILFSLLLKETRIKKVQNMLIEINNLNSSMKSMQDDPNLVNIYSVNKLMEDYKIKSLNNMVFSDLEVKKQKLKPIEIVAISGCLVLSGLITVFTFLWGVV